MKYKSTQEANAHHTQNYRSDGIKKGKHLFGSRDYNRIQFILNNIHEKSVVLDVGCNTGTISIPLQEKNCYVKAIDIVPELVEKAKKNGVFASVCGAEKLIGFKNESFDSVICSEVLEHLFDPDSAISEAKRVLKEGGKYLVTIPHPESVGDDLGDFHHQNFTLQSIINLITAHFDHKKITVYDICINSQDKTPQWLGIIAIS